jgi:Secretion system C-terminal sorting domain
MKNPKYLLLIMSLFSISIQAQSELFIAKNGNDNNSGSALSPLATLTGARDKARSTGAKTIWIRGGRYKANTTCDLGESDSGLTISGYNNEKVIFDGAVIINSVGFALVSDGATQARLHKNAIGKVYTQLISDSDLISIFSGISSQLSIDDKMMIIARFPNIGYGHIVDNTVSGEKVNIDGDVNMASGAQFKIRESIDATKWNTELKRIKRAAIKGYISADWLKETNPIFSVGVDGTIKLMNGSRYGIKKRGNSPNRLFANQLLCELDEPGEWYFDPIDKKLFIYPYQVISNNSKIGVWAGPKLFNIVSGKNIKIQNLTIQNMGKGNYGEGVIDIKNSSYCQTAGLVMRYIAAPLSPINIYDGDHNGIQSCDFFDFENSTRCYGGKATSTEIIYGHNYIQNCHFTQVYSKDFYGKAAALNGAGNRFTNNLMHNMNGQPFTHSGVDHSIELNEAFNVGIEEGDGGAFYTGGSIWSYGNVIKHNFVHHIMSVPQIGGKAAFYSDDYDGGENISENVLYKGGWETIKMNGGGGHTVQKNVLLECFTSIRNGDDKNGDRYKKAMEYITNNKATIDEKTNYMGRMLKAIGKQNWETGLTVDNWSDRVENFWTTRYPYLGSVISKYNLNNKMNPYECRLYDNLFYDSKKIDINAGETVVIQRSQKITLALFEDPANLNFKFKEPRPAYAPNIPFEKIGLYKDNFRCAVPDKNIYRKKIKNHFANKSCHTSDAYDFNTINQRLYYNTGKMVLDLLPCYNATAPDVVAVEEYKFDLGTPTSPVFEGYTKVSHLTAEPDYGWANITNLDSRDRGNSTGANDINRDFVFSTVTKTFVAKINNGTWKVTLNFGDVTNAHDKIQVKAQGQIKLSNITTTIDKFITQEFTVNVIDGKLSLEFSDQGGVDKSWIVNRIWLTKQDNTVSLRDNQVETVKETNSIKISPNPVTDKIDIQGLSKNDREISIIDTATGRSVIKDFSISVTYEHSVIDVSILPSGIYILKTTSGKSIKFIKN